MVETIKEQVQIKLKAQFMQKFPQKLLTGTKVFVLEALPDCYAILCIAMETLTNMQ